MSFSVIAAVDGLTDDQLDSLLIDGRGDLDAGPGYPTLLADAGFINTEIQDVTDEYERVQAAWIRAWETGSAELVELFGEEDFSERQARRHRAMRSIQEGLVVRYWITASKP
jgi:hypothetical protein